MIVKASIDKPFYKDDAVRLYHGDCRDVLRELLAGPVPCVVTSLVQVVKKNESTGRVV